MLRSGVTTGLCAAAAAKAATITLLTSASLDIVEINAKNGAQFVFDITYIAQEPGNVICAVIKDSGDDPDVTNGAAVCAAASILSDDRIVVDGGEGIGRVTKPGLKVPVGMAAINPVPMEMITAAVNEIRKKINYNGGVRIVISIPGGEELAKKTMNERLGIVGGLSILGTTGIVEPMSERAIIETIKADIDVQTASGSKNLLVTPGNYGRDFASTELGYDIDAAVKCSNYIGDTLDYACLKDIERITLIGHAGKLVKLAGGIMNTHSSVADCRMEILAAHAALAGVGAEGIERIMRCVSTAAAIDEILRLGVHDAVWESIGQKIGYHLRERTKGQITVEYIVFTQEHGILTKYEE